MKLGNCTATNFGSYKEFEIDFSNNGLALIYGPTGAGKSTIPDVPNWILFGQTAKGGAADDVKSWQGDGPTQGTLEVETNNGQITVTRIRGSAKQNDLYWVEASKPDVLVRGKDLADTQKLLIARLAVDQDSYIAASYFHEFSSAGTFFTAKAKERREIFEGIADLSLPARLAEASSAHRKVAKQELVDKNQKLVYTEGRYNQLLATAEQNKKKAADWEIKTENEIKRLTVCLSDFATEKASKIKVYTKKVEEFETERQAKIDQLVQQIENTDGVEKAIEEQTAELSRLKAKETELKLIRCKACGGPTGAKQIDEVRAEMDKVGQLLNSNRYVAKERKSLLEALRHENDKYNFFTEQLEQAKEWVNPYEEQLAKAKQVKNPYTSTQDETEVKTIKKEIDALKKEVEALTRRYEALNRLYDLTGDLRGELLKRTVKQIELSTNRYLENYFDAELKVEFTVEGDDLDVTLQKSGYECAYKQLSKGQRSLLRLCFVVSIMQAASNKSGAHFGTLFFDEALDGLDSELKVKAFSLFSELETSHDSVLLIDHAPEFQQMFTKRYSVSMSEDISELSLEQS